MLSRVPRPLSPARLLCALGQPGHLLLLPQQASGLSTRARQSPGRKAARSFATPGARGDPPLTLLVEESFVRARLAPLVSQVRALRRFPQSLVSSGRPSASAHELTRPVPSGLPFARRDLERFFLSPLCSCPRWAINLPWKQPETPENSFRKVASKALAKPASGKARANSSDAAAQEGGESDTGGRTMSVSKGVGIPVKLLHEAEGHIVTVSRGGDLVLRAGGRALLGPRPPSDLPTNRCGQAEQRSHSDERRLSPFLLAARTQVELKTGETFRGTLKVSDAACGSAPFRSDRRAAEVRPRPLSSSPGLTGASHPPLHSLVRAFRTQRTIGTASLRMSRPRRG